MKDHFKIRQGNIIFQDTHVLIDDKMKNRRNWILVSAIFWILLGIQSIVLYNKTNETWHLWAGVILIIVWIAALIQYWIRNDDKCIPYDSIEKWIIKKDIFHRLKVLIQIKGSQKKRSVLLGFDRLDLNDFESILNEKNIEFERDY